MDSSEKYERARIELIEAELQNIRNHLCAAAGFLANSNPPKATELLEKAQYAYALASFHIEKALPEQTSLSETAETLNKEIEELEQQIKKNSNDH